VRCKEARDARATRSLGAQFVRVSLPVAGVLLLAIIAGCGSRSAGTPANPIPSGPVFALSKTRSCLLEKGARIRGRLDFVASTATGGAFVVHLRDNSVAMSFGQTAGDGANLQSAYQRFARVNVRPGLSDVLRRYANVVTLWHEHPQDGDLALIVGCLE
jgi:hypothetical protein